MRDVLPLRSTGRVAQAVRVDGLEARIGENRVVELRLPREVRVGLRRIDHHAYHRTASLAELIEVELQTLQLRHAERSPVAAIEDQEERRAPEVVEADRLAALIDERERRRGRTDLRPRSRR